MTGLVKGWCPSAYRPMMSGDGLIVRVKPRLAHMTAAQALGLCAVSTRYGNGVIDLTSRANLQLRGVTADQHNVVLDELMALSLLDDTPEIEQRRAIVITPDWRAGDVNMRLHDALCARLADLPALPAKMGFAIDAGVGPMLGSTSTDFRIEQGRAGLIVRADGVPQGRAITEITAIDALIEMADWFCETGGVKARRMTRHVKTTLPCAAWRAEPPLRSVPPIVPGARATSSVFGAAFGSLDAQSLAALIARSGCTGMRLTPWRLFILENASPAESHGFITVPDDPVMGVHACPGAPACAASTVDTRRLARALAPHYPQGLHLSGCAKGCAHPRAAAKTLVGRDGTYDLVADGHPWDHPIQQGLTALDLLTVKT